MKNIVLYVCLLIAATCFCGCGKDDYEDYLSDGWLTEADKKIASDPNSIIGAWELETLLGAFSIKVEIPSGHRDLYIFNSNGKVKCIINTKSDVPHLLKEDGIYDYSYDEEKQIIIINRETYSCFVSDDEMHINIGYSSCYDGIYDFILKK